MAEVGTSAASLGGRPHTVNVKPLPCPDRGVNYCARRLSQSFSSWRPW